MIAGNCIEMPMIRRTDPRSGSRISRDYRIGVGEGNVLIEHSGVDIIAASPEFRDQKMGCDRRRCAARVAPHSRESPVVTYVSRSVAGVTTVRLIVDESTRRSAATTPNIAGRVKHRIGRGLDA